MLRFLYSPLIKQDEKKRIEHKKEEEKEEKFDAGDLQTINPSTHVTLESFLNVAIGNLSLRYIEIAIEIAIQTKLGTRFAVVNAIEINNKEETTHHLLFNPSLPFSATKEEVEEMEVKFGEGSTVQADDKLTGIVHPKCLKKHQLEAKKNKENNSDSSQNFLLDEKLLTLGLSCTISISPTLDCILVLWKARSTKQIKIFQINPIGYWCFLFASYQMNEKGYFTGRKYTTSFHIMRSICLQGTKYLMEGFNKILKHHFPALIIESIFATNDFCLNYTKLWDTVVRYNKNEIKRYLELSAYVVIGLKEEKAGEFWPKQSDIELMQAIIMCAKSLKIQLNFNLIPEEFRDHPKALPPLALAIHMNKFDIVCSLIENGAQNILHSSEHYFLNPDDIVLHRRIEQYYLEMQEAIKTNNSDRVEKLLAKYQQQDKIQLKKIINGYLTMCLEIHDTIKTNNIKQLNKLLEKNDKEKLVNLNEPVDESLTPLGIAIKYNRIDAIQVLLEYKVNLDTPVSCGGETALHMSNDYNVLFLLLKRGATKFLPALPVISTEKEIIKRRFVSIWTSQNPADVAYKKSLIELHDFSQRLQLGSLRNVIHKTITLDSKLSLSSQSQLFLLFSDVKNLIRQLALQSDVSKQLEKILTPLIREYGLDSHIELINLRWETLTNKGLVSEIDDFYKDCLVEMNRILRLADEQHNINPHLLAIYDYMFNIYREWFALQGRKQEALKNICSFTKNKLDDLIEYEAQTNDNKPIYSDRIFNMIKPIIEKYGFDDIQLDLRTFNYSKKR